jgi:hypothetical protein
MLKIPPKLLLLNPTLSENELRTIIRTILKRKDMKLRTSHLMNFNVPYIGKFKSHGNKKTKRYQSDLIKDREKKRKKYWKLKELKNDNNR